MDYEFRRDPFGGYRARFSMGHEAIGQWLIDEVGKDEEKLDELFALCDQLNSRLNAAQTTQLHLADALVEQAIC